MVHIRFAIPSDIAAIRSVQRQTWFATYPNVSLGITREDIEEIFTLGESFIGKPAWIANVEGAVVAYCTAKKERTQNRILALYVLPPFQRLGIGEKLFSAACDWLGKEKPICVNVAAYNENAISFYEKMGCIKTGKSVTDEVARLPRGKTIPEIEMVKGPQK